MSVWFMWTAVSFGPAMYVDNHSRMQRRRTRRWKGLPTDDQAMGLTDRPTAAFYIDRVLPEPSEKDPRIGKWMVVLTMMMPMVFLTFASLEYFEVYTTSTLPWAYFTLLIGLWVPWYTRLERGRAGVARREARFVREEEEKLPEEEKKKLRKKQATAAAKLAAAEAANAEGGGEGGGEDEDDGTSSEGSLSDDEDEDDEDEAREQEMVHEAAAVLEHFDLDQDGFLSKAEMASMEEQVNGITLDDDMWTALCEEADCACPDKGLTARELGHLYSSLSGGAAQFKKVTRFVGDSDPFAQR